MKKIISVSQGMKNGVLDDDYTLYDNGEVLHEYDSNIYPSGTNLKTSMSADDLSSVVKQRLLEAADEKNKKLVKSLLKM